MPETAEAEPKAKTADAGGRAHKRAYGKAVPTQDTNLRPDTPIKENAVLARFFE